MNAPHPEDILAAVVRLTTTDVDRRAAKRARDKIAGEGRDIVGKVKQTAGDLTGDTTLKSEGLTDQLGGKVQKMLGAARDIFAPKSEPLLDKARRFSRERPLAALAIAGVLGVALLNSLRAKR